MARSSAVPGMLALGLGQLLLVACWGGSDAGGGALSPAEVFRFSREPVSFSPPPQRWTRDTAGLPQSLTGLRFALDRGVAGEIVVGEYRAPGLVDARDCLRALIPIYAQLSLVVADQATFTVEEVAVAPYMFAPESYQESYRFEDVVEERVEIGGTPALRMSYRVRGSGGTYRHGRWVYLLSPNHHLFAFHYMGREGPPVETFDRVVASISFPPAS